MAKLKVVPIPMQRTAVADTVTTLAGSTTSAVADVKVPLIAPVVGPGSLPEPQEQRQCAKCGTLDGVMHRCGNGYACDSCLETVRIGRDKTTQLAKQQRSRMLAHSTLEQHQAGSGDAAGSHLPAVIDPQVVALDAAAHRTGLLARLGTDSVALALDTANSLPTPNAVEVLLAHQLAVAHKSSLECLDMAFLEPDVDGRAKLMNAAARMMAVCQTGALALHRLGTGGRQIVRVEHVHVSEGGQAIIGNVQSGAGDRKS